MLTTHCSAVVGDTNVTTPLCVDMTQVMPSGGRAWSVFACSIPVCVTFAVFFKVTGESAVMTGSVYSFPLGVGHESACPLLVFVAR